MNIDFENEMLMFCLKSYDGTTEDGREFTVISRNDGHSTWIEDIEHDDDFTDEELKEIEDKFYEGIN
jgi:hypothetical protein